MKFQKERCFTALNAEQLKVGSRVYVAHGINFLKESVEKGLGNTETIKAINDGYHAARFFDGTTNWHLAYLVEEPEEQKEIVDKFIIPHSKAEQELNLHNNLVDLGIN